MLKCPREKRKMEFSITNLIFSEYGTLVFVFCGFLNLWGGGGDLEKMKEFKKYRKGEFKFF
jgi:hypothetical protein